MRIEILKAKIEEDGLWIKVFFKCPKCKTSDDIPIRRDEIEKTKVLASEFHFAQCSSDGCDKDIDIIDIIKSYKKSKFYKPRKSNNEIAIKALNKVLNNA